MQAESVQSVKKQPHKAPYDLSEKASERGGNEDATTVARQVESDDTNEETGLGPFNTSGGGDVAENRVATSIDEE